MALVRHFCTTPRHGRKSVVEGTAMTFGIVSLRRKKETVVRIARRVLRLAKLVIGRQLPMPAGEPRWSPQQAPP